MSLLLPQQLGLLRAPDFDFNAGFLARMVGSFEEFIAADGLLSAGPSPGPLTEIVQNRALLLEIIAGANRLTTPEDPSRAGGIAALSLCLEALDLLCQKKTGQSLEGLVAIWEEPDRFNAGFLNRVADTAEDWLRLRDHLLSQGGPLPPGSPREYYDLANDTIESALDASAAHDDPAKSEALTRLHDLRDRLRELLP